MKIKNIIDEDFSNYKVCSMFIGFPRCTFKCEHDCGCKGMCQNAALTLSPDIDIDVQTVVSRYVSNPLSQAIVCGGLEPFDSLEDLVCLVTSVRSVGIEDPIIIYTGYNKNELEPPLTKLRKFNNIIIKYGRFVPNQEKHFDAVLGVYLASSNQYAERLS